MKLRTEAKRDEIVRIATELFMALGYERTSMSEIAARVGGSKATLYGYFPSKEALFIAVTTGLGEGHMAPAVSRMADGSVEPAEALQHFGETALDFMCSPQAVAAHRMVLAEAGHSDIGRLFFDAGPRRGLDAIAQYLRLAMDRGQLRRADADLAARHFFALLNAETQERWFDRDLPRPGRAKIKTMVARAVAAFLGGYGGKGDA